MKKLLFLLALLTGCSAPVVKGPPPVPSKSMEKSLTKRVQFGWTYTNINDIDFFKLYYGPKSRAYTNFALALTTNLFFDAELAGKYYTVTAAKTNGLESDYSNEIFYPKHFEPRTNVVLIIMYSTNGTDWIDFTSSTNKVPGQFGLWKLRIE